MAKDGGAADPLRNPRFQEPSVWQLFRESLFGKPRLLDCIQVEVTSVCPGRCVYCPHTTQAGYWRSRNNPYPYSDITFIDYNHER